MKIGEIISFNSNGTATLDTITGISNITYTTDTSTSEFSTVPLRVNASERHYPLQPKMSLPKTTGKLKIPQKPKVIKPEDSVKDKKKAQEDKKKKKPKKSKK